MRRVLSSALLSATLIACTPGAGVKDYAAAIEEGRAFKNDSFATSADSPVPADKKGTLLPLAYYPVDESFNPPATLDPSAQRTRLRIPTSTGQLRDYERVGTLRFTLKGQPMQLTAFSEVGQPVSRLFIPFADTTSGTDTYAAGRYLELDPTATGIYSVDFNTAYHPFCYYNAEYDCPFPPAENRLEVAITAGEKLPPPR